MVAAKKLRIQGSSMFQERCSRGEVSIWTAISLIALVPDKGDLDKVCIDGKKGIKSFLAKHRKETVCNPSPNLLGYGSADVVVSYDTGLSIESETKTVSSRSRKKFDQELLNDLLSRLGPTKLFTQLWKISTADQ